MGLTKCSRCKKDTQNRFIKFSPLKRGFVCPACWNVEYAKVSRAEMKKLAKRSKIIARVAHALYHELIVRPNRCQHCHKWSQRIEGHHEDYAHPIDLMWLCKPCHGLRHRLLNRNDAKGLEAFSRKISKHTTKPNEKRKTQPASKSRATTRQNAIRQKDRSGTNQRQKRRTALGQ